MEVKQFYDTDHLPFAIPKQGENQMAEVDTMMLAGQHSDMRKEAVDHTNEIVREGLKNTYDINSRISDGVSRTIADVDRNADRLEARFFDVARDTQDIRAQIIAQQQQMLAGFNSAAKDSEINALKTQIEISKQSVYLGDKIASDGDKTRALINDLKYNDLNRTLIERNSELVEERGRHWHWRGAWDQSQFAALQNQIQAFNSQLSDTRQSMVNFGLMAGTRQDSTNNTVS